MARENILDAIGDIARDKGIAQERLVAVIQEAVETTKRGRPGVSRGSTRPIGSM